MQPDNQPNYWGNDADKAKDDVIRDVYAPQSVVDEPQVESDNVSERPVIDNAPTHWSATEYISEEKNGMWFVFFAIITLSLIAADILFLKSYTFSVLVLVMALAVIVFSRRPPRTIEYTLSGDQGLYIGEKLYHFSEFRAFGVINDRGYNSIMLIPVKRFSTGVSVYFPEEVGEAIVDILGARLPMEPLELDLIDKIVRKLRI
jgi:hypothetical protein